MCGIAGLLGFTPPHLPQQAILAMTRALEHRGPDDQGTWLDTQAEIALGQRRLAIIDVSPAGHQPMFSACGRYVCVFNGEIYNHLELRAKLDKTPAAPHWRGHSDTETLLACFALWGIEKTLPETVGMFAIAVWDRQEQQLHLIRDRMGEKPLYYGWVGGSFVFASELKALRTLPDFNNPLNRDALTAYLRRAYVPAPHTIYQDIYKLEAGQRLTLDRADIQQRRIQAHAWWSMAETALHASQHAFTSESEALSALEQQLRTSVRLQTQADVPLGAFLSGGIDSSTIVSLMQAESSRPIKTFTVGFEQAGFNEAEQARAVAQHLGTDHTEFQVGTSEAREVIPLLPHLYDEPFADTSQIPTYLVCRHARQHVTVALSGDAGDELFGGYSTYLWAQRIWQKVGWLPVPARNTLANLMTTLPPAGWNALLAKRASQTGDNLHKLARALPDTRTVHDLFDRLSSHWQHPETLVIGGSELLPHWQTDRIRQQWPDPEHAMMLLDSLTGLPDDILCKVDRAAMGVSLETRVPLLDHRLFELAWRLPLHMKIRQGQGKWALRQILYQYVPASLVERPKQGFNVPIADWLRGDLREWAENLLEPGKLHQQAYLDGKQVRQQWQAFLAGKGNHQQRLWTILMFQAWLEDGKANGLNV